MVTVRINETSEELDVIGDVTYVKQVNDIGDITKVNSSFTWQLKFPKSPKNTKAFKGLGIAGSTSNIPYEKIVCQILYNGQLVEPNGNLIITETVGTEYKGYVRAGIIDFIQDISNDLISDVIDLSVLNHFNTVNNIKATFDGSLPYKYIIAYYNGQKLANLNDITNLNPFALVPSISVKWLWDRIFEYYGWTYSGNFDLTETYMTYPESVVYDSEDNINALNVTYTDTEVYSFEEVTNGDISTIDFDYLSYSDDRYTFTQSGNYNVVANLNGYGTVQTPGSNPIPIELWYRVVLTGSEFQNTEWVIASETAEININVTATSGQELYIQVAPQGGTPNPFVTELYAITGELNVDVLGVQEIDFSAALIKLKVKDFFKEILVRNALTPFVDVENKAIRFRTLDERLTAPKEDWTSKYVTEGRSEKYIYNSYSQKNIIKHKYNSENENWANGVLLVDNDNQAEESTLYDSFTYAPEEQLVQYFGEDGAYFVQNFKMFETEVSEEVDEFDVTTLIVDYKQLKDRFYFIKSEFKNDSIYLLNELVDTGFPLAVYSEVFGDIVYDDYSNMNQLINNAKIVTIDLAVSMADVVMLDFHKRYYFNQEKAYFILNSLTWKKSELSSAEFIKINS